ncbi:MAG TPA: hypothetical protein VGS10_07820 [Terracidiphilus sp.]|nr:hypothetical protein [Terracidiphilus sp.]
MSPKNPAAVSLGRKGGEARAKSLTAEQRSEAARKAVKARWAKFDKTMGRIEKGLVRTNAQLDALVKKQKARRAKKLKES